MTADTALPLSELLQPGDTLMVGTDHDGVTESRPLTVARVDGATIHILMDMTAAWAAALHGEFPSHVTLSDNRDNRWVSMSARGSIAQDRLLIDELWNPFAGSFFEDGKDSPNVAVMSLLVTEGQYWDTPGGRIGSLLSMLKARFGDAEDIGSRGTVDTTAG